MRRYIDSVLTVIAALVVLLAFTGTASAIPAFSREHNTECSTCHTIFPALNEYGDVFKKNGFVWAKEKKEGKADGKKNGGNGAKNGDDADAGRKGISEPLWLAGLPQTVPLSISATLNAAYNDAASSDKLDLSTRAVSLLAGGVFRDKLGFFLKYNLYAEGDFDPALSNTPVNLAPPFANDLEEFYLVWRNTLGSPVNVKAGRFRPQLSLWSRSNKIGITDFATSSFTVGSSKFRTDSPEDAVEANAVLFNRLYLAGGVVDRNGQDSNEGYGHVSLKIGGSDFHAKEPDLDLDNGSFLDYVSLVIGGYGYSGRNSNSSTSSQRNNFFRGGVEMDLLVMNARVRLAWAKGIDANPDFSSHLEEQTDVYAAQGEYLLATDLVAMLRYEYQEMGNGTTVKRIIPAVSYTPMQNAKLTLEYQHAEDKKSQPVNLALFSVRAAF